MGLTPSVCAESNRFEKRYIMFGQLDNVQVQKAASMIIAISVTQPHTALLYPYHPAHTLIMSDLDMDAAPCLDLSLVPNFLILLLQNMSLSDRFTCALVGKAWAGAATAATRSIVHTYDSGWEQVSCLQTWLEKHGNQMEVLQLHRCDGAALTALPCQQLQELLLTGLGKSGYELRINSDV